MCRDERVQFVGGRVGTDVRMEHQDTHFKLPGAPQVPDNALGRSP
jgi:hypothetical protein